MKNVLIVEDKVASAEMLEKIVKKINTDIRTYIALNKKEAYTYVMEVDMDLMLIDIVLDTSISYDVSGMRFAQNVRRMPKYKFVPIIIVTSLEDPKLYSYSELHCYSYIEKPIDVVKTEKIIKEALEYHKSVSGNSKYIYRKEGIFYSIDLDNIVYIESFNRIVTVHMTNDEVIIPYIPFVKLLEEINSRNFIQCNRYCIVNKKYIEMVDIVNRYVKMKNYPEPINIGAALKKRFLAELKEV